MAQKNNVVIGILAGLGIKTTPSYLDKIIYYCQELYNAKYDSDFPHLLIYSVPTPFIPNIPLDHTLMQESLGNAIELLKRAHIDMLSIPSNLAHIYYDYMSSLIEVPILHIAKESIKTLSSNTKKAALIAIHSVIEKQIYQNEIKKTNIEIFHNDELQKEVSEIIITIKQIGITKQVEKKWRKICELSVKNNCDTLICAATDLSPCLKFNNEDLKLIFIDSTDALAKATVKNYMKLANIQILPNQ